MGQALAIRLLQGGHTVSVWNRSPGKTGEVVAKGAKDADSIEAAAADAEAVITSLANDAAAREVAEQVHGCAKGIHLEASTISPGLGAELAGTFERFVALPVLGSPDAVRSGKATYLVGGSDQLVRNLEPMLSSLSEQHRKYSAAPLAFTAKLTINLLLLSGIVALAEGVAVGRAGGLSDRQLAELLGDSPMMAPGIKNRLDAVMSGSGSTWWTMTLGAKDVRLASEVASGDQRDLPVAEAVARRYQDGIDAGLQDSDIAAVARLYRQP